MRSHGPQPEIRPPPLSDPRRHPRDADRRGRAGAPRRSRRPAVLPQARPVGPCPARPEDPGAPPSASSGRGPTASNGVPPTESTVPTSSQAATSPGKGRGCSASVTKARSTCGDARAPAAEKPQKPQRPLACSNVPSRVPRRAQAPNKSLQRTRAALLPSPLSSRPLGARIV